MFVRYFVNLPLPAAVVERLLLGDPGSWLPGLAERASRGGARLLADVGFDTPSVRVRKRVAIELGQPTRLPSKTVLPFTWRATGPEVLFPELEADLEVGPLGPRESQLAISARYRPPLGVLGSVVDRALLHRVAEATLKDFLDRVGRALVERELPAERASAPG